MSGRTEVVGRVRLTYAVAGPLSYVSVLDMGRLWERILRRAGVPLAYTQGYHPHPRIYFAAPLPVGYTSECELIDVLLSEPMSPGDLLRALTRQVPAGLTTMAAEEVAIKAPKPQSRMEAAHYVVEIETTAGTDAVRAALAALLARDTIMAQRHRRGKIVDYDMRRLIHDLVHVAHEGNRHRIAMNLRCGSHGSGRPERIVPELALGKAELISIHRTRLIWDGAEEHTT